MYFSDSISYIQAHLLLLTVMVFFSVVIVSTEPDSNSTDAELPDNITNIVKDFQANEYLGWTPGIDTWEPREEMVKNFPYYLAGYDHNKRPVVVWEAGLWKIRKYLEQASGERKEEVYKYTEKKWFTISNLTSPYSDAEDGIFLIMDASGFEPSELASLDVIRFHLQGARIAERIEDSIAKFYIINTNFVSQLWLNICRPVGGRYLGKAEGFVQSKTNAALAEQIPRDQLPSWYGGTKGNDYKPLQIFG